MTVAELVYHYESIDQPNDLIVIPGRARKQGSFASLRTNNGMMFDYTRNTSPSSVKSSSSPASPLSSCFGSPTSQQSSPTFYLNDTRYQTTDALHPSPSLLSCSAVNLQAVMMTKKHVSRKASGPWYTRRALSQIDLAMESERRAGGFENAGLDLFEPRPRETIVSRQTTQCGVVLDGIFEVLENTK